MEAAEQRDTRTSQQSKDPWQNKATGKKQSCKQLHLLLIGLTIAGPHFSINCGWVLEEAKLFSMEQKRGDLGKDSKIWGFLRQWANSSANTAGTGRLHSLFSRARFYIYICVCVKMCMYTHTQNSGRKRHKTSPFWDPRSSLGLHLFLEKLSLNETT